MLNKFLNLILYMGLEKEQYARSTAAIEAMSSCFPASALPFSWR